MTPEQMLASLQDEVRGLSETVQPLASENETFRSQSTGGAVKTVTMANEVARLNKPTAFSGAEEEHSDWDFALTCFLGTMEHVVDRAASGGSKHKSEASPDRRSWERSKISWHCRRRRDREKWCERYQTKTGMKRTEASC